MSDPNQQKFSEWFEYNYPKDYYLLEEIKQRISNILNTIRVPNGQPVEQPIMIKVGNAPSDPSRLTIATNDYGDLFIGVMAKAILDSLSYEFEALLESDIGKNVLDKKVKEIVSQYIPINDLKTCSTCQAQNRPNASYCDSCGNLL